jgi:hypothetical protein
LLFSSILHNILATPHGLPDPDPCPHQQYTTNTPRL